MSSDDESVKVRENRLRRKARRQGLELQKSRRRDPHALDYGTYQLVDATTNSVVASGLTSGYGLTLGDIERELTKPRRRR
jgi:hypothetical protein